MVRFRQVARHFLIVSVFELSFMQVSFANGDRVVENELQRMQTTCYMDGLSCPGGCDAHFVSDTSHNSSSGHLRNAYMAGTRDNPVACVNGDSCTMCFSSDPNDCLTSIRRGTGPQRGRFDVTPAFLHKFCFEPNSLVIRKDVPPGLLSECRDSATGAIALDSKINCIRDPNLPQCDALMKKSVANKENDTPAFLQCLREGEERYNVGRPLEEQRIYDCTYRKLSTAHGRSGRMWNDLLPGACPKDTYVSPNGLDCCSADTVVSACSGDCGVYFK